LEMESEDEQEAETSWTVQAPVGNVDCTNVKRDAKQELAAWVQRIGRCCKELLQSKSFGFAPMVIVITVGVKYGMSYQGKFPSEYCPSEWIGYKKKCYFISEEEKNWTSSQTFCARKGSLLAVFEDQEEMHSLAKRLRIDDSWIGLRKKGESFYWENGIALEADVFPIWNHSECAYLNDFTISTSACSLPRRWICMQFLKT
ncbi:PREDICTED: C-type lectin domain family 2 member D-like, partial [Fulmarus glacialis]|uniref:C-type lectin domain family 2 member D-like n=1 Tax=Fulmarus glacialis TaxID=30455 RepID=UPI00051C1623